MIKVKPTRPATQPSQTTSTALVDPPEFFALYGRYIIDPTTTIDQLQDDISCLLDGASAIVNVVADGMQGDGDLAKEPMRVAALMYAVSNIVEMVNNMNAAAIMHPRWKVQA